MVKSVSLFVPPKHLSRLNYIKTISTMRLNTISLSAKNANFSFQIILVTVMQIGLLLPSTELRKEFLITDFNTQGCFHICQTQLRLLSAAGSSTANFKFKFLVDIHAYSFVRSFLQNIFPDHEIYRQTRSIWTVVHIFVW